jgi:hypothetical protein
VGGVLGYTLLIFIPFVGVGVGWVGGGVGSRWVFGGRCLMREYLIHCTYLFLL